MCDFFFSDKIFGDVHIAGESSSSGDDSEVLDRLPLSERQRLATKSLGLEVPQEGINTHSWNVIRIGSHSELQRDSSEAARVSPQSTSTISGSGTWRSSKGGWVADFGAPHTHSLYTGPMYGAGKDALDGTSIAGDKVQWQRIRRQQQVPPRAGPPHSHGDWAATDMITQLADDLSAFEDIGRESIYQKRKSNRSRDMDLADEDSIDTATAGAGEGQQGVHVTASFNDSISLKAAVEKVY
jgi:hypothetical protein